jgi:hypothetical protein
VSLTPAEIAKLEDEPEVPAPQGSSLDARMQRRAETITGQETEWFPIPGWEDMLEVELKLLTHKSQSAIVHHNQRTRDEGLQELYNMADFIVRATCGFRELTGTDEADEPTYEDLPNDTWQTLAVRAFGSDASRLTERQAFLKLVTDKRVKYIVTDWEKWGKSIKPEQEESLAADFAGTGSRT